jgi:DNA-binding CsgD family transcriptional regulator
VRALSRPGGTPLDLSAFSELVGLLYEGLAFPERWPDFLAAVARALDCSIAAIVLADPSSPRPRMGFSIGLPTEAMQEYDAYYGALNPVAMLMVETARQEGSCVKLARCLVDEQTYKRTEYYNDWGRKYGAFHSVNGTLADTRQRTVSLSVVRPERAEPLGSEANELVGLLLPHLGRAFEVYQRMERLRASEKGASEALERLDAAVIALSGDGAVSSMTQKAEAFLQRNEGLKLVQGRLAAANPCQAAEFDQMVKSATLTGAGLGIAGGGAMRLHRGTDLQPLTIRVVPFHSSYVLTEQHPCALVFISDPAARPASRRELLSALYALTPTECRLADLLLEELDLRQVSARMRLTLESARFMLKSIFRKTETHRQSHLIRLLMSLPVESR